MNDANYQQQQVGAGYSPNPYNNNMNNNYNANTNANYYQPSPYNNNMPPPPQAAQPSGQVIYHVDMNQGAPSCPICRQNAGTIAIRKTSSVQWIWCFVIFLVFWPVCCIPFCIDSCSDIEYHCTSCNGIKSYYHAPCCP